MCITCVGLIDSILSDRLYKSALLLYINKYLQEIATGGTDDNL